MVIIVQQTDLITLYNFYEIIYKIIGLNNGPNPACSHSIALISVSNAQKQWSAKKQGPCQMLFQGL